MELVERSQNLKRDSDAVSDWTNGINRIFQRSRRFRAVAACDRIFQNRFHVFEARDAYALNLGTA
jgi:hypothetical protein